MSQTEPQPSSELDLDEGERLLGIHLAMRERIGDGLPDPYLELDEKALARRIGLSMESNEATVAWHVWLYHNGEALVAALKAAQAEIERLQERIAELEGSLREYATSIYTADGGKRARAVLERAIDKEKVIE